MSICNQNLDKEIFVVAEIGNNHECNLQNAFDKQKLSSEIHMFIRVNLYM